MRSYFASLSLLALLVGGPLYAVSGHNTEQQTGQEEAVQQTEQSGQDEAVQQTEQSGQEETIQQLDQDAEQSQAFVDTETDGVDELRQRRWNRWVCYAWPRRGGYGRPFVGYSNWFRAGSGQGQYARWTAYQNSLRQCQYYTGRNCVSRCDVQRY